MAKTQSAEGADKRPKPDKKANGRPSIYTPELADHICAQIAAGKSLVSICAAEGMPSRTTVMRWLLEDIPGFRDKYARGRDEQADFYAEQIIEIADDGSNDTYTDEKGNVVVDHDVIARSRLRVDARKWYASKVAPKKYGEKIQTEHTGEIALAGVSDEELDRRIAEKIAAKA